MKARTVLLTLCAIAVLACATGLIAVTKPYHPGSVWDVTFVRVKPGMDSAYLSYLAGQWKQQQEAMKGAGLILSYKVLETESHTAGDWNLMLMTEFKDMASMEASEDMAEELMEKLVGDEQKQQQGYEDRSKIREIVGDRLAREIVLEPKMK